MEERLPPRPRKSKTVNVDYELIQEIIEGAVNAAAYRIECHEDEELKKITEKHEHLLYGNGKEGLVTKLDRIEVAVTRWSSIGWRLVEVLVIGGVVGVIILLVQNNLLVP